MSYRGRTFASFGHTQISGIENQTHLVSRTTNFLRVLGLAHTKKWAGETGIGIVVIVFASSVT